MASNYETITPPILQTTATGVAVACAPSIVPAHVLGKDAPSNKLTIAFIGTGNNGCNWIARFLPDPRIQVVAVCDVNREGPGYWKGSTRGREYARRIVDNHYGGKACAAYEDFREVLARPDFDAVYIGTPDHWHACMTIAAARAGKHIYCQKPLSLTVHEGRAMSDAVRDAGVTFQTGSHQRSYPNFRRTCETGAQRGRWQVAYGAGRTAGRYARLR